VCMQLQKRKIGCKENVNIRRKDHLQTKSDKTVKLRGITSGGRGVKKCGKDKI
jgi:hypothetical protein